MKVFLSVMLVTLLAFLPVITAVADEAAVVEQEGEEALGQDDDWDVPINIEYEKDGTEEAEEVEEAAGEAEEISPFVGEWLCENASIYIDEEDGTFSVYILWDISDTEEDIWEYTCTLDDKTGALTGVGNKIHEVSDEEGEVVSTDEIYVDGAATFTLDDDALIWADAKEDIAQGLRFERGEEEELLEEYDQVDETEDGETEDEEEESAD